MFIYVEQMTEEVIEEELVRRTRKDNQIFTNRLIALLRSPAASFTL